MLILSLIVAIVVAGLVAVAQNMLAADKKYDRQGTKKEKIAYFTGNNVYQTAGIGIAAGLINYLAVISEGMLAITPILAIAITVLFGLLVYEWRREGSSIPEMLPFVALAVIFYFIAENCFCAMSALITSLALARIIQALPLMFFIAAIALMLIILFLYKEGEDGKKAYRYASIVIAALVIVCVGFMSVSALDVDDFADGNAYAAEKDKVTEEESLYWDGIRYYNDDVRADSDPDNDYNFGSNPYVEGETAEYYVNDFESRRSEDPALLSATMLTLDNTVNTDYIGSVLYQGYDAKLNVLERADAATKVLASDKEIFDSNKEAVTAMLDSAKSVKLVKESNITDQLYMNGYTSDGIPQVVLYETDTTSDWVLEYTFQIKTSEVKICFRIPCGYQWTNPYEVLKENASSSTSSGGGGKGGGSTPTPTPKPKKNTAQDPVNNGNGQTYGGKNRDSDGTGDKQSTAPSKGSGSNAGGSSSGGSSSGGSSSGQGSDPANGSGVTTPIDTHDDSGGSNGDEKGEFSMD